MTKILVIEDETPLRMEILEWLTFEGYEAIGAANGVEGVNCAVLHLPDLIVCDISMPVLDGYGVLLDIQANSILQSSPFIFLSARADKDDIRKGMGLGADDYITKPFDRSDLLQAIHVRMTKKAELDIEHQEQMVSFKTALATEHQERLFQAKLVAMFSHDLANQLTVVMTLSSLLRNYGDQLTEERRMYHLNSIEAAARLLLAMRDDMLIMAQMDTANFVLKPEPLDINHFVQDIVQEFQTTSGETHHLQFKSYLGETVSTDARLLRQIVANLISNAIKYSPAKSDIQVLLDKHDTLYVLSVEDHGIGIPATDRSKLFDAFQRGSNVGKVTGTGLGLAVVKQAVDILGGLVQIESQVDIGTTITVTLPCLVPNS